MAQVIDQEYEATVPVDTLIPDEKNANQGDVDFIRESIRQNQFVGVVTAHRGTQKVLAGNHTLEAAKAEGLTHVPVLWINASEVKARVIAIAINEAQRRARWKVDVLAEVLGELAEMDELAGTGYDADRLDDLLAQLDREMPVEEFEGGYTEDPEEVVERASTGGVTKVSQGLREVVLVLKEDDYQNFVRALGKIRNSFQTDTTSATVFEAVMRQAEECE